MFYETLTKLCAQKGISLTSLLSEELKMSTGNITNWKKGILPKSDTVSKLAAYFNVSIDYLLGTEQKNKPLTERERLIQECIDIMGSLPEDYQKAARDHLRTLAALSSKNKKN